MTPRSFALCAWIALGSLLPFTPAGASEAAAPAEAAITVIYDAFGQDATLRKDWGYAALIEYGGKRILFDTGNDPAVLAHNARALKIDLTRLDFVVMSHRHGDHMGGLAHLLTVNPRVPIYAPKEGFGVYGGDLPGSFYRTDATLPPERRYYDGAPPATLTFGAAWPGADFRLIEKTTQIAPGVHLIAEVSDKAGTRELRELSLALETEHGLVLVVGCSHPGLDRIVAAASTLDPRVYLIAGGFHHVTADDATIATLGRVLHEQYRVGYLAPGHCTGEPTFSALAQVYGDHYLYAGLGSRLHVGADPAPLAALGRRRLDSEERLAYLDALATGDDHQRAHLAHHH
jgi:7,8-dihydropterin-6-yl-methyl-4-(beta-D-ribofuranosyl)aminobenzene 5'-phosphate synthase